jgi:hypothetical protein
MTSVSKLAIAMTLAGAIAGLAGPAVAGCKRMGFLVNDYGKEGPTNDAKSLLDKHIAQWAAEQGIEKYTVGKKDVKCDLFLNLIVVDEHTCTASATVCWGNDKAPSGETAAGGNAISEPKPKKPKKEAAAKAESKPQEAKATETKPAEEKAADAKPAETKAEEPAAAAVETSAPTKVETGALPLADKPADEPAPVPEGTAAATTPPAHEAAANAAEAAAAAAERAAAAAERAAQAAERAAAALAASGVAAPAMPGAADTAAAASSSVSVPPLAAEGASKP